MDKNSNISYRINNRDEIVFVNDEWSDSAVANNASDLTGEKILRRSLWNFISDETIKYFYREILRQVRGGQTMRIDIRCDSPAARRLIELTVSAQPNGDVLFESRTVWVEDRPSQTIFSGDENRSSDLVIVCSWCKKVDAGREDWQEVEEAVKTLGLFEKEKQPLVSHGMCRLCHEKMSEKLKSLQTSKH